MYRKKHLSASSINRFLQCPVQYRKQYLEKLPFIPSSSMTFGRCIHKSQEHNFSHKKDWRQDRPLDELEDVFRDTWKEESRETKWTKEEVQSPKIRGSYVDEGVRVVAVAYEKFWRPLQPVEVEQWWRLELSDCAFDLVGRWDTLIEVDTPSIAQGIQDLKITSRTPQEDVLDRDLAVTLYTLAFRKTFGKSPKRIEYDYLIRKKTGVGHDRKQTERTAERFEALANTIDRIARTIESGIFLPPPPGAWWCSQKWCPYFEECKEKL